MSSNMEISSELKYSGILYILGSILFTIASTVGANSEEQVQEDIKQKGRINSSFILFAAFLAFVIGSLIYLSASHQRLEEGQKQSDNENAPPASDLWAYAGAGILLLSTIVLLISGQLRIQEAVQSSQ